MVLVEIKYTAVCFEVEITSKFNFTTAAETILEAFNKRLEIEYEVHKDDDFVDIIKNECFEHLTKEEAADLVLKITACFFDFYHVGVKYENS